MTKIISLSLCLFIAINLLQTHDLSASESEAESSSKKMKLSYIVEEAEQMRPVTVFIKGKYMSTLARCLEENRDGVSLTNILRELKKYPEFSKDISERKIDLSKRRVSIAKTMANNLSILVRDFNIYNEHNVEIKAFKNISVQGEESIYFYYLVRLAGKKFFGLGEVNFKKYPEIIF